MARRGHATPKGATRGSGFVLSQVVVRPVRDAAERAQWDRLIHERHYPGFRDMFGDGLRHVAAGPDGRWLALPGWCAGAFKVGVRDAWLGWAPEQQFRRLRLVANNCRFLVLAQGRIPNLASRVLALSVRRLSGDMQAWFGHPVLLAKTFRVKLTPWIRFTEYLRRGAIILISQSGSSLVSSRRLRRWIDLSGVHLTTLIVVFYLDYSYLWNQ